MWMPQGVVDVDAARGFSWPKLLIGLIDPLYVTSDRVPAALDLIGRLLCTPKSPKIALESNQEVQT